MSVYDIICPVPVCISAREERIMNYSSPSGSDWEEESEKTAVATFSNESSPQVAENYGFVLLMQKCKKKEFFKLISSITN